jgi:hypothetical protein
MKQKESKTQKSPQGQKEEMRDFDGAQTIKEWEKGERERKEEAQAQQKAREAMGFGKDVYFSEEHPNPVIGTNWQQKQHEILEAHGLADLEDYLPRMAFWEGNGIPSEAQIQKARKAKEALK